MSKHTGRRASSFARLSCSCEATSDATSVGFSRLSVRERFSARVRATGGDRRIERFSLGNGSAVLSVGSADVSERDGCGAAEKDANGFTGSDDAERDALSPVGRSSVDGTGSRGTTQVSYPANRCVIFACLNQNWCHRVN